MTKNLYLDEDTHFDQKFTPNPTLTSKSIFEPPSPTYGQIFILADIGPK